MPAHLVNAILQALPADGVCMTIAQLVRATGCTDAEVSATATKMIARRWVERVRPGCFRLTKLGVTARQAGETVKVGYPKGMPNGCVRKPTPGTLRARLWQALRQERKATVADLLVLARNGTESENARDAQRYMAALADAGIVIRMPRPGPNGELRYFLADDPGPKPPIYRRARGQVFEPNARRVIELEAAP